MDNWRDIMREAEIAKAAMTRDRFAGEKEFDLLLRKRPKDGMVYFKRGEAYEVLRENALAAEDFRHAKGLFPMAVWKARAGEALLRVARR